MKAPIHSVKHYVQTSLSPVLGGNVLDVTLVRSVEAPTTSSAVREGALVKAMFIELWVLTQETATGSFVFTIQKRPSSIIAPTAAQMAALHDWSNKKNILYTTQGLVGDQDANPIPLYKGWIKIPKGKQRMGLDDRMSWSIFAQAGIDLQVCGMTTYKEYT